MLSKRQRSRFTSSIGDLMATVSQKLATEGADGAKATLHLLMRTRAKVDKTIRQLEASTKKDHKQ